MENNLIVALTVSCVTGITFIAYKHPNLYEKAFAPKLTIGSLVILAGCLVYDSGASNAFQALIPFIQHSQLNKATKVVATAKSSNALFQVALGILIYSLFLSWLADHFKEEHTANEVEKPE